jgi:hypothetical protein
MRETIQVLQRGYEMIYDFDGELIKRARFFLDQRRARREFESG